MRFFSRPKLWRPKQNLGDFLQRLTPIKFTAWRLQDPSWEQNSTCMHTVMCLHGSGVLSDRALVAQTSKDLASIILGAVWTSFSTQQITNIAKLTTYQRV